MDSLLFFFALGESVGWMKVERIKSEMMMGLTRRTAPVVIVVVVCYTYHGIGDSSVDLVDARLVGWLVS